MSRDRLSLTKAFVNYVRSLLEYNSVIWTPYLNCDIERVEQVQRRFTKRLRGLKYADRLKLPPLVDAATEATYRVA